MSKCIKIDLMKYVPLDTHVILDKNFRNELFKKIKHRRNKKAIIKHLNICRQTFEGWDRGDWSPKLTHILELGKISNFFKEDIINNIRGFKSRFNRGLIFLHSLELYLSPELGEWLGLVDGDGCINKKYVDCANTCFDLIFFFVRILQKCFGIKKNQITIEIRIPVNGSIKEAKSIEMQLKSKGYSRIFIRKMTNGNNFLLISRANIKVLAVVLDSLFKDLDVFLKNSPDEVKAAYLRGFFAAEGSINLYKKCRTLEVSQKHHDKILFIKKLLLDVGIEHIKGPKRTKHGFKIYLRRRKELEKFSRKIGFGYHKTKNQRLQKITEYSLSEFRDRNQRYGEILDLINSCGSVNKYIVAQNQNVSKRYVEQLLREMANRNLITADKSIQPYTYSLRDKNA